MGWLAIAVCIAGQAFGWNGSSPQTRPLARSTLAVSGLSEPYAELIGTDRRGRFRVCLPPGRYSINLPWSRTPLYQVWPSTIAVPGPAHVDLYIVR